MRYSEVLQAKEEGADHVREEPQHRWLAVEDGSKTRRARHGPCRQNKSVGGHPQNLTVVGV